MKQMLMGGHIDSVPNGGWLDGCLNLMGALEVLRRIRADKRTYLLPVVLLTSSREEQDLIESYKSGANSYIRKPVDFIQLIEAVRQLGLSLLVLNEVHQF